MVINFSEYDDEDFKKELKSFLDSDYNDDLVNEHGDFLISILHECRSNAREVYLSGCCTEIKPVNKKVFYSFVLYLKLNEYFIKYKSSLDYIGTKKFSTLNDALNFINSYSI